MPIDSAGPIMSNEVIQHSYQENNSNQMGMYPPNNYNRSQNQDLNNNNNSSFDNADPYAQNNL
jgi:hypothetical protein